MKMHGSLKLIILFSNIFANSSYADAGFADTFLHQQLDIDNI